MAHGVSEVLGEGSSVVKVNVTGGSGNKQLQQPQSQQQKSQTQVPNLRGKSVGVMGSRRIFSPAFKIKVLDSYRNDIDCRGNQRATARKYGIHRRQIQKWLQCEENLRSCCVDGANGNVVPGAPLTPPQVSPQKEAVVVDSYQHHQQQQQQLRQAHNGAPASSPALNLSLARLHGDELAVQQRQQPPPPPPPPPSATSSVVAAQALATTHQHHQANYRFHGAAAVATGYPDLKDKAAPIQPAQQLYPSPSADYSTLELYHQPLAPTYHQQQHHQGSPPSSHHHHQQRYEPADHRGSPHKLSSKYQHAFEAKVESSSSSSSSSTSPSSSSHQPEDESHHNRHRYQERRCGSSTTLLLAPSEIKTERASPDSAATTPVACETTTSAKAPRHVHSAVATSSSDSEKQRLQQYCVLKNERFDDEEQQQEEREAVPFVDYPRAVLSSSSVPIDSPASSHQDHTESNFESLPPSPERSIASSSSDSEMEQHPGSNGSADLARRRSFSLRFKLDVLDAFHRDTGVAGNQRATARKFGINRRQVQKWLGQESELRGVIELCGSNNRQRLGPVHETGFTDEAPIDLRTGCTVLVTDLGQVSPNHYNCCDSYSVAASPSNYVDSSLTPPYSAPGCSLSCCQDSIPSTVANQFYYSYSFNELDSSAGASLKRSICTQPCCYTGGPASKKICLDEKARKEEEQQQQPIQETPLCLVKPKRPSIGDSDGQQVEPVSSTVPTPPTVPPATAVPPTPPMKKDAILFKPYLDNPVSKKPSGDNNNCQDTCNLNEGGKNSSSQDLALELSFRLPVNWGASQQQQHHHHTPYLEFPQVRSAFIRYPASAHYS